MNRAVTAEIDAALAAGARQIKLKIAPGRDVEPLTLVRERYPDLVARRRRQRQLSVGRRRAAELAGLDLAYLEQPLAADDLDGAARLVDRARHADRPR